MLTPGRNSGRNRKPKKLTHVVHRRTRLELLEDGSQQAIHRRHGVGLFAFGDDDEGCDEPRTLFVSGDVVGIGGRLLIVRPLRQEEFVFGVCGEGSAVGRGIGGARRRERENLARRYADRDMLAS